MPKADADYASKLDQSELIRDGLQSRWDRRFGAFKELVKGHEREEEIMDLFDQACKTRAGLDSTIELVDRYKRLVEAQTVKRAQLTVAPGLEPVPAEPKAHSRSR